MPEPVEVQRAHEWLPAKRGERASPRCRVCGAVKTSRPTYCYVETVEAPAS